MESPWRRTFSSVFIVLCVNNVYVFSQNIPGGQPAPQFAEYGAQGLFQPHLMNTPANGIYTDVLPPGRPFPDVIVQPPGLVELAPGFNSQQPCLPPVSQLLLNLPKPNIIGPIAPPGVPPLVVPLPQYIHGAFADPCPLNNSPPPLIPNVILPPPYLHPNPQSISTSPNGPYPQNYGPPPIPQHVPVVPCPQPPPTVSLSTQFVPALSDQNRGSVPQLQRYSSPPQHFYIQNFDDIGANNFNLIPPFVQFFPNENTLVPPTLQPIVPAYGQFTPNPGIPGPYPQIQMLPPAVPPFADQHFTPQQLYAYPNNIPTKFYPLPSQHLADVPNVGPSVPPPMFVPEMCLPNLQPIFPPPTSLPPPIPTNLLAPAIYSFPQGLQNPTFIPNQQIYSPSNYQLFTPEMGIQPQYHVNALPTVVPTRSSLLPSGIDNSLPINLQINVPPTNMLPPYITIISTVPPNPSPTALESCDTDSPYPLHDFVPFPTYPPPPIIVQGSKSKRKKWIPILVALFANSGCCGGCSGNSCGSCNNIPIPFPIVVPTNNPIVVNKKKSHSKCKVEEDTTDMK